MIDCDSNIDWKHLSYKEAKLKSVEYQQAKSSLVAESFPGWKSKTNDVDDFKVYSDGVI